jgi:hypothetical protein
MKTKIAFLAIFLTFAGIRMSGQSAPEEYNWSAANISTASPPTFETTTSGLEIKVWVMTAEEHQKMMESNNDKMINGSDKKGTMENKDMAGSNSDNKMAMSGTHHIKVVVADPENGQPRNDLTAKVEITSPSKKISWVDLRNKSDHYGSDLNLLQKGSYTFTISIDDNGTPKTTRFNYTVQ